MHLEDAVKAGHCEDDNNSRNTWFMNFVDGDLFDGEIATRFTNYVNQLPNAEAKAAKGSTENTKSTWKGNLTKLTMYSAVCFLEFLRKYKKIECKGQAPKLVEFAKASAIGDLKEAVSFTLLPLLYIKLTPCSKVSYLAE